MEKTRNNVCCIIALIVVLACNSNAGVIESDWTMPLHDIYHTSYSKAPSDIDYKLLVLRHVHNTSGDSTTPVIADINSDGKGEIIVGSREDIDVLGHDFEYFWSRKTGCRVTSLIAGEIRMKGTIDILYSCDKSVTLLDASGSVLWTRDINETITAPLTVMNIDYGASLETIYISGDRKLNILNSEGTVIRSIQLVDQGKTTPLAADFNSDDKLDLVVGSENNKMNILSVSDPKRWFYDSGNCLSHTSYIEDEEKIILGGSSIYKIIYETYSQGNVRRCNSDGSCSMESLDYSRVNSSWELPMAKCITAPPALADLDGDGEVEIITGSLDKTLYIVNGSGQINKRYSVNGKIPASPLIADLNWDDYPEIIFCSSDGTLHILNSSVDLKWSYNIGEYTDRPLAFADIERDISPEIFVPAGSHLYIFGQVPKSTTQVTSSTTSTTQEPLCDETDNGVDIFNRGSIVYRNNVDVHTQTDYCEDEKTLIEWSCQNANLPERNTVTCPETYECVEGVCITIPTTTSTLAPIVQSSSTTLADEPEEYVDLSQAGLIGFMSQYVLILITVMGVIYAGYLKFLRPAREKHEYKKDLQTIHRESFRKKPQEINTHVKARYL